MGVWKIGADELADSRMVVSPLLETVGSLLVLLRGRPRLDQQDWYHTHRPAFRHCWTRTRFSSGCWTACSVHAGSPISSFRRPSQPTGRFTMHCAGCGQPRRHSSERCSMMATAARCPVSYAEMTFPTAPPTCSTGCGPRPFEPTGHVAASCSTLTSWPAPPS